MTKSTDPAYHVAQVTITIQEQRLDQLVDGMTDNWPECSGEVHRCTGWNYEKRRFALVDEELDGDGPRIKVDRPILRRAVLDLLQSKFTNPWGALPPFDLNSGAALEEWLCQCDADEFGWLMDRAADIKQEAE